ncbi:hypothetical protein WA026_023117 [Henosepilachna vigintioctopunctata]|uniref:Uncharacterized protein n=1 Tax=Henosepilachna vigintioctopunctata TaxID=420089 RepID=A0AAW1UC10_9CUCU
MKMPMSNIYGTSTDVESDDSIPPVDPSGHYVDPWDLENYAYLKEHLDSADLTSGPTSMGDFVEAHSSFDYVPVLTPKEYIDSPSNNRYDTTMTDQGTYACIDELGLYDKTRTHSDFVYDVTPRRNYQYGRHSEIRVPTYNYASSFTYKNERNSRTKKLPPSTSKKYLNHRDRSISFAYGDDYEIDGYRQDIYSRPEEKSIREDIYYPIYDDPRNIKKPNNFGLSNYGHLKIDYSYSWNNLNKYIVG